MCKILKIALLVFFLSSTILSAEEGSDARVAILKYFEAAKSIDTSAMSDLMHPEALKQFRNAFDSALNGTKRDLARSEILPIFGSQSIEDYKKLGDREAYKRFNDLIFSAQPDFVKLMNESKFEIVTENIKGDIAYFTYTLTINYNGKSVSKDVVQKLKLHNGNWLLLLAADAEASIAGISARYN